MAYFIGVDVSKESLDVHIRSEEVELKFPRTSKGILLFVKVLKRYEDVLVVFEASGGYEKSLHIALRAEGIDHRGINLTRVRDFARACGKLAKTDTIDAEILSLFAEKMTFYKAGDFNRVNSLLEIIIKLKPFFLA